ncbi:MAG TPA: LysM peptidoglycan-binding domain-containing protein [Pyrinomonadaceae bacterium]|nr:LysM peptidoglycan-binding domain-containing protein [Pyrinomonadaceae bacterium]
MGLFDKMFGSGAAAAQAAPDSNQRFEDLKNKYRSVLSFIDQNGVRLQNLHVDNDKLFIRGTSPSDEVSNKVWDQIKLVDPNYQDITVELSVDQSLQQGGHEGDTETYTVKAGDSLWKIAKNHFGDGNEYMKIFYANRDKMQSPDSVIHPGDVLNLPKN